MPSRPRPPLPALVAVLALIRNGSWLAGGGFKSWSKARFHAGSHLVLRSAQASFLAELSACFLHTPSHVIFHSSVRVALASISPNPLAPAVPACPHASC